MRLVGLGSSTPETERLHLLLEREPVATGDLILTEVLQGFSNTREFNVAKRLLSMLEVIDLGGSDIAVQAAQNFRALRSRGITVRKTIDTVIATCIESELSLLFSDRDFEPFVRHLGLRSAMAI